MRGLYIHIPFCKSLCSYCDFPKRINQKEEIINKYLSKLENDINNLEESHFDTVYIGGGTPNLLSLKQLEELLITIKKRIKNEIIEFTIETNYEFINQEQINLFKKYGINRISIGVQTLNKDIGKVINRISDFDKLKEKVELLKENGLRNINLDFIFGLPNEKLKDIKENLKQIYELDVPHISYYSLILEDKTLLQYQIENKIVKLPDDDLCADMYNLIIDEFISHGYHHYELSNFSKPGFESKHNIIYWSLDPYIGLGMSASSFYDGFRTTNSRFIEKYLTNDDIIKEKISIDKLKGEYFWLGLRKIDGVSIKEYQQKFNSAPLIDFEINKLIEKELLIIENDYIKLTRFGIEHGNYVFTHFI